jgi:hypothetical protein
MQNKLISISSSIQPTMNKPMFIVIVDLKNYKNESIYWNLNKK